MSTTDSVWYTSAGLDISPYDEEPKKEYIEEIHRFIKQYIKNHLGLIDIFPPVLYGGSVKLENCKEILSSDNVDALLIGGASLDSETFSKIYNLS